MDDTAVKMDVHTPAEAPLLEEIGSMSNKAPARIISTKTIAMSLLASSGLPKRLVEFFDNILIQR